MKPPRGIHKIPVHLYGGVIWFCKDRKIFEKAYKLLHDEDYPEDTETGAGLTLTSPVYKDGEVHYLSGVFDHKSDTAVHEATHVALFIMKRAGINPHDDDGESFCYLLEFVYNSFCKYLFTVKRPKTICEYKEGREW